MSGHPCSPGWARVGLSVKGVGALTRAYMQRCFVENLSSWGGLQPDSTSLSYQVASEAFSSPAAQGFSLSPSLPGLQSEDAKCCAQVSPLTAVTSVVSPSRKCGHHSNPKPQPWKRTEFPLPSYASYLLSFLPPQLSTIRQTEKDRIKNKYQPSGCPRWH